MIASTRTRVLVVGDAGAWRERIARELAAGGGFEVVGDARVDPEAVAIARSTRAELVVLDTSDRGLASIFVSLLMAETPTPILGLSSSASFEEVRETMIDLGVVDVVDVRGPDTLDAMVRTARLVARIRVVTRRAARIVRSPLPPAIAPRSATSSLPGVVAVGASTGGPSAVAEFLQNLPRSLGLPVLVVVHIGPSFGYSLADWLATSSAVPVHQAAEGMRLEPGHVYVCPPERHLLLRDDRLALSIGPERHSCRPSVDVLFESVADAVGDRAIGCLMTGIGRDGAAGLLAMQRRGALTIAQDEASCVVFGMPREAIALGAANLVASPPRMAALVAAHALRIAGA